MSQALSFAYTHLSSSHLIPTMLKIQFTPEIQLLFPFCRRGNQVRELSDFFKVTSLRNVRAGIDPATLREPAVAWPVAFTFFGLQATVRNHAIQCNPVHTRLYTHVCRHTHTRTHTHKLKLHFHLLFCFIVKTCWPLY